MINDTILHSEREQPRIINKLKTLAMKAFNFEVYTSDPITGTTGWDIKNPTVFANDKKEARQELKDHYPNFDCVILFNYEVEITDGSIEAKHYATGAKYFEPTYEEQYNR